MYSLVTIPNVGSLTVSTTAFSGSFFSGLLPLVWPVIGITVAVYIVLMMRRAIIWGGRNVTSIHDYNRRYTNGTPEKYVSYREYSRGYKKYLKRRDASWIERFLS